MTDRQTKAVAEAIENATIYTEGFPNGHVEVIQAWSPVMAQAAIAACDAGFVPGLVAALGAIDLVPFGYSDADSPYLGHPLQKLLDEKLAIAAKTLAALSEEYRK